MTNKTYKFILNDILYACAGGRCKLVTNIIKSVPKRASNVRIVRQNLPHKQYSIILCVDNFLLSTMLYLRGRDAGIEQNRTVNTQ